MPKRRSHAVPFVNCTRHILGPSLLLKERSHRHSTLSRFYDRYTHLRLAKFMEEKPEAPDSVINTIKRIDRRFPDLKLRFTLATKHTEFVRHHLGYITAKRAPTKRRW
jgi:hypothetical protein